MTQVKSFRHVGIVPALASACLNTRVVGHDLQRALLEAGGNRIFRTGRLRIGTLRMITKLPPWIWIGAAALAFIAGIVNAVGFLSFQHQGVSHLTGTTTLFGMAIAGHNAGSLIHLAGIVLFFVLGAMTSGFVIQDSTLRLGRRYGAALLIEAVLLASAVPLLSGELALGDYLISAACGLQNAMVSTYSGASLRTTHLTGVFTDLGIFIGHLIRRAFHLQKQTQIPPTEWRRFRLWITLIVSFAAGGTAGGLLFPRYKYGALYIPALLTGTVGMLYGYYAWNQKRKGLHHEQGAHSTH